jgi:hypothetical protein
MALRQERRINMQISSTSNTTYQPVAQTTSVASNSWIRETETSSSTSTSSSDGSSSGATVAAIGTTTYDKMDANHNGKVSVQEELQYAQKHPKAAESASSTETAGGDKNGIDVAV